MDTRPPTHARRGNGTFNRMRRVQTAPRPVIPARRRGPSPAGGLERAGQWMRAQRPQNQKNRGMFTRFLRLLSGTPELKFVRIERKAIERKPTPFIERNSQPIYRKLSKEMMEREPKVFVGGREIIPREKLKEIMTIITNEGLQSTIMQIAHSYPRLTELLQDPYTFAEFVQSDLVPAIWKTRLMEWAHNEKADLRAVGILIYLFSTHRNPPEVEQYIRQIEHAHLN